VTPISFRIDIDPHGKGRGRVITVAGRGAIKTPEKTKNWEAAFALMSARHRPAGVLDEPLVVEIVAEFARPRRMCKRSMRDPAELLGGYSGERVPMAARPDADNVAKAVLDAMASWWRDDALVVDLRVRKFYHAINRRPCVRVIVRSLAADTRDDTRGDRGGCGCGGSTAPAGTCLA